MNTTAAKTSIKSPLLILATDRHGATHRYVGLEYPPEPEPTLLISAVIAYRVRRQIGDHGHVMTFADLDEAVSRWVAAGVAEFVIVAYAEGGTTDYVSRWTGAVWTAWEAYP
jgi:hypothetical protein